MQFCSGHRGDSPQRGLYVGCPRVAGEYHRSTKRMGHPNFMGVKLDGLRLSIGLNLPCAVPVATGCTISWNKNIPESSQKISWKFWIFESKILTNIFSDMNNFYCKLFTNSIEWTRIGPNRKAQIKLFVEHWFITKDDIDEKMDGWTWTDRICFCHFGIPKP